LRHLATARCIEAAELGANVRQEAAHGLVGVELIKADIADPTRTRRGLILKCRRRRAVGNQIVKVHRLAKVMDEGRALRLCPLHHVPIALGGVIGVDRVKVGRMEHPARPAAMRFVQRVQKVRNGRTIVMIWEIPSLPRGVGCLVQRHAIVANQLRQTTVTG